MSSLAPSGCTRQGRAAKVAAWYAFGGRGVPYGYIAIRNASDLPVTGVEVAVEMWGMTEQGPLPHEVPEWKMVWSERQSVGTLPPGSEPQPVEFDDHGGMDAALRALQRQHQPEFQVSIRFRDSNNVWWARNTDGVLNGDDPDAEFSQ